MKFTTLKPISNSKDLFFPFAGNMFDSLFNETAAQINGSESAFKPGANILETEKAFEIQLALPGMKKEDVKIDLHENNLTVSGERIFQTEETKGTLHYNEIRQGKFSRSFVIPENITHDAIEANFANGMLEITLPKAEPKQAKAIAIK